MEPLLIGRVLAIAIRAFRDGPMIPLSRAVGIAGAGLEGDVPSSPDRGVTLLSARQWSEVVDELGVWLPWLARRANVLVDAPTLAPLIGHSITVGSMCLTVRNETTPCAVMNRQHPGLEAVLTPGCRGGVYGRIDRGGIINIGDEVAFGA